MRIDGVPPSFTRPEAQRTEYYVEEIAPGIIQYTGLDGTVLYQEAADGLLAAGGHQYAFGYAGALQDQEYIVAGDG